MDAAAFVVFSSILIARIISKHTRSSDHTLIVIDNGVAYHVNEPLEIVHTVRLGSTAIAPMTIDITYDVRVIRDRKFVIDEPDSLDDESLRRMLNRLMHTITILEKHESPLSPDMFQVLDHFLESAFSFVKLIARHHEENGDTRRIVAFFLLAILQCGLKHRAEGFVRMDTLLAVVLSIVARTPSLCGFFQLPVVCRLEPIDLEARIEAMNKFM